MTNNTTQTILFHPSSLKNLMSGMDKPAINDTCQTCLWEHVQEQIFMRPTPEFRSNQTDKGLIMESEAIRLLSNKLDKLLVKNQKTYENDYFIGTPDIVDYADNVGYDIKCRYDFISMMKETEGNNTLNDYKFQMQAYMDLTGLTKWYIVNVLVNTPEEILTNEKWNATRGLQYNPRTFMLSEEEITSKAEEIDKVITGHHTFYGLVDKPDIPDNLLIHIVEIDRDKDLIDKMHARIDDLKRYAQARLDNVQNIKIKKIDMYKVVDGERLI